MLVCGRRRGRVPSALHGGQQAGAAGAWFGPGAGGFLGTWLFGRKIRGYLEGLLK